SNPCINSNRARTTNDEGEQTINPRIAADGAYIIPGLEERRDRLLHHELYVSRTSFGMVMQLKTRLRTINRAAQLNRWFRLNRIPTTLETNIPELATTYWNAFADFLETGLDLNKDNLLVYSAEAPVQDCQDSIISHPDNVYAKASRRVQPPPNQSAPRACFCCGSTSHMISQCTAPEPAPRANQQVDSQSGCSFTSPSGFTSHHPIITPPNFNSSFNPNTRDQPCSSNLCPADSYRPNYPING
ncbi:hypothetical protein MJO29_015789, partial [Puccinia striiformis f. sp. tritici]